MVDAGTVGDAVGAFVALGEGCSLTDVGWDPDQVRAAGQDVRAFYEEAALALSDHVPGARQVESWFYTQTQAGSVIAAAAAALREAGEDRNTWYYILPGNQAR